VVEAAVDDVMIVESTTDVDDGPAATSIRELSFSAFPNPVAHGTALSLSVPVAGRVRIDIVDVSGRRIRRLYEGRTEAGVHRIPWDGRTGAGRAAAAGIYFGRVVHDGVVRSVRLLVVK
jgi:hypothetical protein